jgi:membrane-bound metal-dependent hydrolase YbcI (DUF457 family)
MRKNGEDRLFLLAHFGVAVGLAYAIERSALSKGRLHFDYRLVLVGAVLPDIIDKPLSLTGLVGGRSIAHTALFALALTALVSILVIKAGKPKALYGFPMAVWIHLLLDSMWKTPGILLWPAFGFSFPVDGISVESLWHTLLTNPYVYGGETVGAIVLAILIIRNRLYTGKAIRGFLRNGALA